LLAGNTIKIQIVRRESFIDTEIFSEKYITIIIVLSIHFFGIASNILLRYYSWGLERIKET